ncbi:aminotransferase class I/II-fold pyridoxal phosphate-dependent enzyme [Metabacillus indicus]|uniref:Arginine decarboxylase n=1 Tax=Metabacillus indicus TaxID=246786 RepID=A0A084GQQ4_METID|nr:aminotransferase class I/II-fold pyridoxal phosphate-dependent enzyme [Metabacillus indicus]KEZ49666.1 arginine decarboxylase [Metabacillus indicus]
MAAPLYEALKKHELQNPVSFHVPGHKYGKVFPEEAGGDFSSVLRLDATEITGLDDLHDPSGPILEAQRLAAELYQADETYFLVNGSTSGNLAMIMACCEPGKPVLVQRNSHKSIIHAIRLSGAKPVFLSPRMDEAYGVPSYVEIETVSEAIRRYPGAKALILTNPNYYGITADLREAVELAHREGIPVLVDEAHGAHFVPGMPFPASSIEAGADAVVQSAHKTLPAMTMGSFLHVNGGLVDRERLSYYLSVFQSSSPSYPIMASLDLAREYMERLILSKEADAILRAVDVFKKNVEANKEVEIVTTTDKRAIIDPLKLTIRSAAGLSGFELQRRLEKQGVFTELADIQNVLLVLPLSSNQADSFPFTSDESGEGRIPEPFIYKEENQKISMLPLSYGELNGYSKEVASFEDAAGLLSGEAVIPYPPGIPLLMEGEVITEEHVRQIRTLMACKARFQGGQALKDGQLAVYIQKR